MPAAPISVSNAAHYTWTSADGTPCDGWHLLRTPELSILEERMPPGAAERRHRHTHARQFFFVLAGELTLELLGDSHLLHQNEGLEVGPGILHQVFNRSAGDARFLVTSQPPSHGDRTDA